LPLDSALATTTREVPVLVVCAGAAAPDRVAALRETGVDVFVAAGDRTERLRAALDELGRRDATSMMVEGGAGLTGAFLEAGEVDELRLFIAPLLLGAGRPLAAHHGAELVEAGERPLAVEWERSGDDMLVRARLREW
jgi:diaminohydroxyphosphoribosylaminopyrimidine deaminase/5-amino-6-(5-phosphoribosylamino)uracil reductase